MTTAGHKTWPKLTSREEFKFIAEQVLKRSTGDHTVVTLHDQHSGTTRFANNQIVQNVDTRRGSLSVMVAFGQRHGNANTTDFTAGAVQEIVTRATEIAQLSPDDPEYLPPVERQSYLTLPTMRAETAVAGPARRLEYTNEAIGQCRMENLGAAGIVSSALTSVGVAASTGLFAHEERTDARFSLTAQAGESTGWSATAHRSIDHLRIQERTLTAIDKAKRGLEVRELPPGRYTVILEPAAVAGLSSSLLWMLDAKSYEKGTSAFSGKLGKLIVDERLTFRNLPAHEDLLGIGFTGIVAGGAMATHVIVHEREAMPVPKNLSLTDAGAIPEVFLTAYDALFLQAGLKTGETMLVHAAGSGIGTAAIQLARAISATSVGTSRTADKLERCAKLGLDIGVVTSDKTFAKSVVERTGGRGVDVILDTVGAGYLGENVQALAPRGRIITIGLLAGVTGELPLGTLLAKRASITGSVLRSRPLEEKAALAQAASLALVPLFERGALVPVIDRIMPMTEIRAAHEYLESNRSFGKLVMTWK